MVATSGRQPIAFVLGREGQHATKAARLHHPSSRDPTVLVFLVSGLAGLVVLLVLALLTLLPR